MSAIAGRWTSDTSMSGQQDEALRGIVAGVKQLPDLVGGFWSRDVAGPAVGLTLIVFETSPQAEEFRRAVERNSAGQRASGVAPGDLALVECGR